MQKTNVGVITTSDNVNVSTQPIDNCLKSTSQFTQTIYQNVCNGQSYVVPNGSLDIVGYGVLIALGVTFCLLLGGMMFRVVFDY